ncbi:uncharacterized protein LOC122508646 [Leptopilina heterotoma]|uniref:uncharacterized protein LOC122508646 n=1 Tax=Leptopilina heterotoma TaxID=63436 RepID=UPI001CA970B3|nr:uncharacterized protein LOC122508646 [Leptopilina heterotoma]
MIQELAFYMLIILCYNQKTYFVIVVLDGRNKIYKNLQKREKNMNSSLKGRFFPNECYICKSRKKLERCDCKTIAYCSKEHRLQHLSVHESFCKAIQEVIKEKALLRFHKKLPPKMDNNDIWNDASGDKLDLEKKLGRNMTPLELSMWIRPRVCFTCNSSKGYLHSCPDCPIVSFCKSHKTNQAHTQHCKLMNRYLKTLSTAEELNIDLQFLPLCFPYTTERFEFLDPLTYTVNDYHYESKCNESASTKENLIDFINIASKLNVALEKIYDKVPEKIVLHIEGLHHNRAILKEHYWEFLLHANPKIKNLKIVITKNNLLKSSSENYSLCEKCVKTERKLSVEKCSLDYEDYLLQDNYQVPDVLFYFKYINDYNFKRFNEWIKIGCSIILLTFKKNDFFREPYFLAFLHGNLEMIFNGEINTAFNEKQEFETDSHFVIFQTKRIREKEISPADNCNENDEKSRKDDSILIEDDERLCEEKFAESEKENHTSLSPLLFSSTIDSELKEGDETIGKNENNDNSKVDDENDEKFLSTKNEFLLTENSYLKTKNKRLQQELNSSIENVAKKQKRIVELEEIFTKEIEKNNSIKTILQN